MMRLRIARRRDPGKKPASGSVVVSELMGPQRHPQSMSVMFGGSTAAIVIGLPLDTTAGQHAGWRTAFWMISVGALAMAARDGTGAVARGRPLILVFGFGMTAGNAISSRFAARAPIPCIVIFLAGLVGALISGAAGADSKPVAMLDLFLLSLFGFAAATALQTRILDQAHGALTLAARLNMFAVVSGRLGRPAPSWCPACARTAA